MYKLRALLLVVLVLGPVCGAIAAQRLASPPPAPEGASYEITEYEEEGALIQEYRIKGFLYGVRVVPKRGKPYFLINSDGDSNFYRKESRDRMLIPEWTIFSW